MCGATAPPRYTHAVGGCTEHENGTAEPLPRRLSIRLAYSCWLPVGDASRVFVLCARGAVRAHVSPAANSTNATVLCRASWNSSPWMQSDAPAAVGRSRSCECVNRCSRPCQRNRMLSGHRARSRPIVLKGRLASARRPRPPACTHTHKHTHTRAHSSARAPPPSQPCASTFARRDGRCGQLVVDQHMERLFGIHGLGRRARRGMGPLRRGGRRRLARAGRGARRSAWARAERRGGSRPDGIEAVGADAIWRGGAPGRPPRVEARQPRRWAHP